MLTAPKTEINVVVQISFVIQYIVFLIICLYIYIYIYVNRFNSEVCTYNELSKNPFNVYDGSKL